MVCDRFDYFYLLLKREVSIHYFFKGPLRIVGGRGEVSSIEDLLQMLTTHRNFLTNLKVPRDNVKVDDSLSILPK